MPVGGAGAYANLLRVKIAWVQARLASAREQRRINRDGLTSSDEDIRSKAQAATDKANANIAQYTADLVVLRGPRNAAQGALLRRNVNAWISALDDEISFYQGAAEEDATKAKNANSRTEARNHRNAEARDKAAADRDKAEKDALSGEATAAGV